MELDLIRKELNYYDNIIKTMITLRMSLIPIVATIKIKNEMPLFQGDRENEIYKGIEEFAEKSGVNSDLVKNIYQLIMTDALKMQEGMAENLKMQEDMAEDLKSSEKDEKIDFSNLEPMKKSFEKLDTIIEKDIPEIMLDIMKECELKDLNLTQVATWYYDKNKFI